MLERQNGAARLSKSLAGLSVRLVKVLNRIYRLLLKSRLFKDIGLF